MNRENLRARQPGWGVDLPPENRPGVPMEASPPRRAAGAHWKEPDRQRPTDEVLKRAGRRQLTPVFGTAVPPRGVSGAIRRFAYTFPDHKARHIFLLMLADRVDVLESRLHGAARPAAMAAALVGGALLVRAALRRM